MFLICEQHSSVWVGVSVEDIAGIAGCSLDCRKGLLFQVAVL